MVPMLVRFFDVHASDTKVGARQKNMPQRATIEALAYEINLPCETFLHIIFLIFNCARIILVPSIAYEIRTFSSLLF